MNICKFSRGELSELGEIVKRQLRSKQMLGRQAMLGTTSYERLSLKREDGGRKSKPMRDVYKLARELRSMQMYIKKEDCAWHARCQSRRIGRSKLLGEGKHQS